MVLTAINTYAGPTTISQGTLTIGGAGQLVGGLYAGNIDDTATNSVLNYGSSAAQTLSGIISGLGSVSVTNGILALAGANTYSGNTTINGGQLWGVANGTSGISSSAVVVTSSNGIASFGVSTPTAGNQFTCASLTINAGGAGANLMFAFTAAPSLSVAPLNVTGTLTFNATPGVAVNAANLSPNTTYPLLVCGGTAPATVPTLLNIRGFSGCSLAWSGNTLQLTVGSAVPIVESLKWTTSTTATWDANNILNTIWQDSAGTPVPTYYAEPVAGSADSVVFDETYITGNPYVILNGTVSPTSVTFSNSTYNYTVSGSGGIAGAGSLTKNGTNVVTLTTANTYSGSTTISAGTLQLGNGTTGHDGTIANSLNVTNNGVLAYNRFGTNTYGGVISGSGQVTKSGAGTQTLSGANTYTGNTTISAGKLALAGTGSIGTSGKISVGSGAVLDVSAVSGFTIGAAQTLNGGGTVMGAVTVNGTLAPTNSVAGISTLTFSNSLTLAGNAVFSLDRNTPPNTNSQVVCLGTVQYGGALVLTNTGSTLQNGDTFTLFSTTGYAGNFGSIVGSPGAGLNYSFNPTNGVLSVVSGVNLNPTNITAMVLGNALQLSWPADHTGWRLLVQTNNLSAGISSNTNDWTTVPGSAGINQTNITMNPALPAEFYRLVYP
jgi:autotransporter-associated beta strand protein